MDLAPDAKTREFYCRAMRVVEDAGIPYLVGGAYAMERFTGISRHTKDFDIFVRPRDSAAVLDALAWAGYHCEVVHPHWLAKVYQEDAFVDVIYRSGNAIAEVDDEWFQFAVEESVLGRSVLLCAPEEILWSKAYIMERERFDGADVAHLLRARARTLDWGRILRRFGAHWRVLFSHLVLFGFVYPEERRSIPDWVMNDLAARVMAEAGSSGDNGRVCQGTLLSRAQYLIDLDEWGYLDARLQPRGRMTAEQIAHWTASIAVDGQR